MSDIILSLKNITKRYPGVTALNNVSLDFKRGEVHALLGENGAGKSTMIKVIAGAVIPDEGEVIIDGKSFQKLDPITAKKHGVEVIYQEFNLMGALSVAENIGLSNQKGFLVDQDQMRQTANAVFEKMGVAVDPDAVVDSLPTSHQQLVEIAKAVSANAKILIMDEPSAPLSVAEVEKMFAIVRDLKKNGVTIIYISHRLDELFEISDRVTVMRDGTYVDTLETANTDRQELINLMVGRELSETYPSKDAQIGNVLLTVNNLCGNGDRDISFELRSGEILGIAGLVGAGRTELARILAGADPADSGEIYVKGTKAKIKSPSDAISYGIGLIPEDRKQQGVFLDKAVDWNISIASLKNLLKGLVVDRQKEHTLAEEYVQAFHIKTPSLTQMAKNLSGGNQQKVALAKTLATQSDILIFDEPTRGIDVGAKQEIYQLMCDLAKQGKAIMMITSDMPELLGMSDRILVITNGSIAGELKKEEFSQVQVLRLASGQ